MANSWLGRRERIVIGVGVGVLLLIGLIPILRGLNKKYDVSRSQLVQATNRLENARELRAVIDAERSGQNAIIEQIKKRPGNFDLYSFTSRCLRELELENRYNLENQRMPSGGALEGVQLTLTGVSMEEVVDLLHKVYSSNNLIVLQRLQYLRPARDGKGLECLLTFMTPKAFSLKAKKADRRPRKRRSLPR